MDSVKTVLTAAAAAFLALISPAASALGAPTAAPRPCDGAPTCYVDVTVAQVWVSPDQVRPVDAPATTRPADVRGWLAGMTLDERREVAEPMMINSPRTGDPVREEPIGSTGRVYVGTTRFLTR
ncbi:hypothetical protein ACQKM2_06770 [Streptomyces sp. NPDC004126]|uniref:hypothetical protein n=1 Tax=Streptomyces sp. NPDC004126 TaxID=3390695 RepID=UPI003D0832DB